MTQQAVNTPKAYGKSIKASDLPDGIARFFPVGTLPGQGGDEASSNGLPLKILLPILRGIRENVAEIREAFSLLEMRMVGGSLLVVYEADSARAEEGLKQMEEDEVESDDAGEDEEGEDDDDDDDAKRFESPYLVKLIDFAHTRLTPGKGFDEGVLLGIDTVLKLIDGRIAQLEL